MKRCLFALVLVGCAADTPPADAKNPVVVMKTSKGTIKIELFEDKAPITVKNFLQYVDDKHYDGTIFHRVISDFMIQGGGFEKGFGKAPTVQEATGKEKKTRKPIKYESDNGLSNKRGTLAMARTNAPDSATDQFFINLKANSALDYGINGAGYAVFGRVVEGMDVVDKIVAVRTTRKAPHDDVPVTPVVIKTARLAQ